MEHQEYTPQGAQLLTLLPLLQKLVFSSLDRRDFHYSKSQLTVLVALSIRDTMTMKEIAGFLASSKEQATRAVAPLADAGLLERYTDPANRVHVNVRLTAQGCEFVQELRASVQQHLQELLQSSLSDDEQAALADNLSAVITLLRKVC